MPRTAPTLEGAEAEEAAGDERGESGVAEDEEDFFTVRTPFKADEWEAAMKSAGIYEEFADVPMGMREGFSLGLEGIALTQTFTPPNHAKIPEHLEFIEKQYGDEIALGRLSKGYTKEQLESRIGQFARLLRSRRTLEGT